MAPAVIATPAMANPVAAMMPTRITFSDLVSFIRSPSCCEVNDSEVAHPITANDGFRDFYMYAMAVQSSRASASRTSGRNVGCRRLQLSGELQKVLRSDRYRLRWRRLEVQNESRTSDARYVSHGRKS